MHIGFNSNHWSDDQGTPTGGCTFGTGFTISWQNGALGRDEERKEPNGAFVEDIISAAIDRLRYYQDSKFACDYNADAISYLEAGLARLQARTLDRDKREVEGTHQT